VRKTDDIEHVAQRPEAGPGVPWPRLGDSHRVLRTRGIFRSSLNCPEGKAIAKDVRGDVFEKAVAKALSAGAK
jgi:hypothetical protein